jgi:hypothetical protein
METMRQKAGGAAAPIPVLVICLAAMVLAGCSGYGTLQKSGEASKQFESLQIDPNYNYFYSGSDVKPRAIIGLRKDYALVSKLWKPVDLTPGRLSGWIDQITGFKGFSLRSLGSDILNSEGEVIGTWYSLEDFTTIRMLGDKQVSIYPPVGKPTFGENVKYQLP